MSGPSGILLAQLGMAQISQATGIKVKYVGTSHQIPFQTDNTRLPRNQDLLIAFADEAELPEFVTRSAIGFGGSVQLHAARDGRNRPVWETTQAAAVFDTNDWFSGNSTGPSRAPSRSGARSCSTSSATPSASTTPGADEIMYWQAGNGVYPDGYFRGLYGAGDLKGLATDGLGQGCFRSVRRFRDGAPARIQAPPPLP